MRIAIVSGDYLRSDRSPDGQEKWGGAGWARIGQYVPYLRSAGHQVAVGHLWLRGKYLTVEDADGVTHYPDVVLMQRLMHGGLDESVRIGRASGQIVINDIDDWYWGLDPRNAAFKASHPKYNKEENTTFYRKIINASDHLTVSTPYLADRMREMVSTPLTIIPNYVDVSRFTRHEHTAIDKPEVGWAGSTDHRSGDIEVVSGVLGPLYHSNRIRVVHGGHLPTSPSFASKAGLPERAVRCVERTNHDEYPSLLDFDIGIVPLRDTPFNHAKSDIKGLEYAAAGIPFIASRSSAYVELANQWGQNSVFLAKHPKDWSRYIRMLSDLDTRMAVADSVYKHVQTRDIFIGAQLLLDFIASL